MSFVDRKQLLVCWLLPVLVAAGHPESATPSFLELYKRGECRFVSNLTIPGESESEEIPNCYMPTSIATSAGGNIAVLDAKQFMVLLFDASGKFLSSFGSEGEGPGELSWAYAMTIDPEDRIVIHELGNRRFSYFSASGEFLFTRKFQADVRGFKIDNRGYYVAEINEFDAGNPDRGSLIQIARYDPELNFVCTLDSLRVKEWEMFDTGEGSVVSVTLPLCEGLVWDARPDGTVVSASNNTYAIKRFSASNKQTLQMTRNLKAPAVTQEDRERYFSSFERYGPGFVARLKRDLNFPSRKAFFSSVTIDPDGNVLVLRNRTKDALTVDAFSNTGIFVGEVSMQAPHLLEFIDGFIFSRELSRQSLPAIVRGTLR